MDTLRYAFRSLLKTPGFSIVAILALALGIGANSAIFSLVHAIFLKPLPYEDPGKIVTITLSVPEQNFNNVAANTTVNLAKGTKSRYALVSGALASAYTGNDAFKLKTFTAPTPGTLALIGLGLGALVWFRRRSSQPAMSPA